MSPWLAFGSGFDHGRSTQAPGSLCYYPARDTQGVMVAVGVIGFAFELRGKTRWFGFRVSGGAELDLGFDIGVGALAVNASAGPVFRF